MATKGSLFDTINNSRQKFITRFHTTNEDNLRKIFSDEILKTKFNGGYPVFTSADKNSYPPRNFNPKYPNSKSQVQLELKLPKEWHRNNIMDNPDHDISEYANPNDLESMSAWDFMRSGKWAGNKWARDLLPVKDGGKVDTYNDIPTEYVNRICRENNECYSPAEYFEKFLNKEK